MYGFAYVLRAEMQCIHYTFVGTLRHMTLHQRKSAYFFADRMQLGYLFAVFRFFFFKEDVGRSGALGIFNTLHGVYGANAFFVKTQSGNKLIVKKVMFIEISISRKGKGVLADLQTAEKSNSQHDDGKNGKPAAEAAFDLSEGRFRHHISHSASDLSTIRFLLQEPFAR